MSRARKSIRLQSFDYASSAVYFVTICSYERQHLFGEIRDGEMILNELGVIIRTEWFWSEVVRPGILLDAFVIMPSHVHAIVGINLDTPVGAHSCVPLPPSQQFSARAKRSLGSFIGQFKATVSKNARALNPNLSIWQRNYHEHIIRNEEELNRIRQYIENNPANWDTDEDNPASIR